MIRTVVKPDTQNISIKLPENFIGKRVEVIAFTVDEAEEQMEITDKPATHYASEKALAKDWLTDIENSAWQNL